MATMHLHNKMEVSFREMIDLTKKKEGLPKHITLDQFEGWGVLNEMRYCGRIKTPFTVKFPEDKAYDLQLVNLIFQGDGGVELTKDEAQKVLQKWMTYELSVEFESIPLIIVLKKTEPVMPPNTTEKEGEVKPKPKFPENHSTKKRWWHI